MPLRLFGASGVQECLQWAQSFKRAPCLLFFNEALRLDDVVAVEGVVAAVPTRRVRLGTASYPAAVAVVSSVAEDGAFNCHVPTSEGLGRWHRPVSRRPDTAMDWHRFSQPAIIASSSAAALGRFSKDYVRETGQEVLALKSFPMSEPLDSNLFGFSLSPTQSLAATTMEFRPLTEFLSVTRHCQNVISELATPGPLFDLYSAPHASLYIRTRSGRIAQIIAGDPAKGLLALSPPDFGLSPSPDDRLIQIGVREPGRALTASAEPRLIITSEDSDVLGAESSPRTLVVELEAASFFHTSPARTDPGGVLSHVELTAS